MESTTPQDKWDLRFLEMSKLVASWSKDPSTQAGAVIVRPDNTIVSAGYNGFPPRIADTQERLYDRRIKYELTVHCEMNALLLTREGVLGCTLYTWPCLSCVRCAVHVIRAGIFRVVAPIPTDDMLSRWKESLDKARALFHEAGLEVVEFYV